MNDILTPPNMTTPQNNRMCSHDGKCLDGASGIHCREWEENNLRAYPPQNMEKENWRDRFDKEFYQSESRVWMSRGGESYGSIRPEMGRGELFRFIEKEIATAHSLGEKAMLEKVKEIVETLDDEENPHDAKIAFNKVWDALQALTSN